MGESLGGGVATWLARERSPAGLILQSTFTSVVDLGQGIYPWLPVRLLCRHRYPSLERVGSITCPKLIMHGAEDEMIPWAHGRALLEAAAPPKEWFDLAGGHNAGPGAQDPQYAECLRSFLERAVRPGDRAARP